MNRAIKCQTSIWALKNRSFIFVNKNGMCNIACNNERTNYVRLKEDRIYLIHVYIKFKQKFVSDL